MTAAPPPRPPGPAPSPALAGVVVFSLIAGWPWAVDWWMQSVAGEAAPAARTRFEYPLLAALMGAAVWLCLRQVARQVAAIRRRNMTLFERAPFCITFQTDGILMNVNPAGVRMYGAASAAELIGRPVADLVHPDDRAMVDKRLAAGAAGRNDLPAVRSRSRALDGRTIEVEAITLPLELDDMPATLSLVRDVTPEVEARRHAARLAGLYAALSKTNEAIFRETARAALCDAVCRIAVEHGGLLAASIRRYDAATDALVVEAGSGSQASAPGRRTIRLADVPASLARVVRDGRPLVSNNVAADPELAALSRHPHYAGVRASAAFPLMDEGRVVGTFSVHAAVAGYFDDELTALLAEMARNLAFGFARIEAEAARQRMESRYRQLFDHVPTGILVHADGIVIMANPAAVEVFGATSADQLLGRRALDFLPAEARERGQRAIDDALVRRTSVHRVRGTILRVDATPFDAQVSWMPLDLDDRRAVLVLVNDVSQEVAARRRADYLTRMYAALSRTNEAIAREPDRGRLCAEVCRVVVEEGGLTSAVLRLEGANGEWTRLAAHGPGFGRIGAPVMRMGPQIAARLDQTGSYVVDDADADPNVAHLAADIERLGIRSGAGFTFEAGAGMRGLFAVYAAERGFFDQGMCDLLQEIVRGLAFAFAKQRADAALRDNEARYRLLFDSSPTGLFVALDNRVVMLNPAGRSLLRAADDNAVLGRSLFDFVRADYAESARQRIHAVAEEGRPVPPLERVLIRTDGTQFDAEVTTLPFEYRGQPAIQFIVNDLTERKAAERALRDMNAELEARVARRTAELRQANQELRDFSYIVSHDLKAPLRGIASLVDWLEADHAPALGDAGRELLRLMAVRARRMHRLIEDILRYSRVGRSREGASAIDLNALLRDVLEALDVPERIKVRVAGPLPVVRGTQTDLEQIFQNLIANAIKYMDKPDGEITIDCAEEPGVWRIGVADNGPGIDPRHHKRIFELFQRLGPKDDSESTGIGLTIVKKIVENLGGSISVDSAPGAGARFSFTLPRLAEPGAAAAPESNP